MYYQLQSSNYKLIDQKESIIASRSGKVLDMIICPFPDSTTVLTLNTKHEIEIGQPATLFYASPIALDRIHAISVSDEWLVLAIGEKDVILFSHDQHIQSFLFDKIQSSCVKNVLIF